jgi:prepilin-type N-terminal cleavage/methylation domain-containing protein
MKTDLKHPFRKAFTMLELIFVIVIVGILSFITASSFQRNTVQEATDKLVSHIRYAQHLAMVDDKFNPTLPNWFRNQWHIDIELDNNLWVYSVLSANNPNQYAKDPQNSTTYLSGLSTVAQDNRSKDLQLQAKFGITSITFTNCPTATTTRFRLFFDYLGRPYGDKSTATTPYANLLTGSGNNICTIVLSNGNVADNMTIEISPETGYVRAHK